MNNVNKTLYIPLYGKAYVSKRGIVLQDKKAEEIWAAEGFELKGKSKSKWLAYYMGMRSKVFDNWVKEQLNTEEDTIVLHLGCGMDSRINRVGSGNHKWYDVDFSEVIKERRRYFTETDQYFMIEADIRETRWLEQIPKGGNAIVVMEGVSMYLQMEELQKLLDEIANHFKNIHVLMDCYTVLAAKASKYKNPINDVGVANVYGIDDPKAPEAQNGITYTKEHEITPEYLIEELSGMEQTIFRKLYAGKISKKMYRLYEYCKK